MPKPPSRRARYAEEAVATWDRLLPTAVNPRAVRIRIRHTSFAADRGDLTPIARISGFRAAVAPVGGSDTVSERRDPTFRTREPPAARRT